MSLHKDDFHFLWGKTQSEITKSDIFTLLKNAELFSKISSYSLFSKNTKRSIPVFSGSAANNIHLLKVRHVKVYFHVVLIDISMMTNYGKHLKRLPYHSCIN